MSARADIRRASALLSCHQGTGSKPQHQVGSLHTARYGAQILLRGLEVVGMHDCPHNSQCHDAEVVHHGPCAGSGLRAAGAALRSGLNCSPARRFQQPTGRCNLECFLHWPRRAQRLLPGAMARVCIMCPCMCPKLIPAVLTVQLPSDGREYVECGTSPAVRSCPSGQCYLPRGAWGKDVTPAGLFQRHRHLHCA